MDEPVRDGDLDSCRRRVLELEREVGGMQQMLRASFHGNPLPMWVYDPATYRFLDVNDATLRHFGYQRDELMAMCVLDVRPPEDVPAARVQAGPTVPDREWGRFSGPWRHRRRNGEVLLAETAAHPVMFEGRPARMVIARDVTERQRMSDALAMSHRQFDTVLEDAPDLIARFDAALRFTYANSAWGSVFGLAPTDLVDSRPADLPLPPVLASTLEQEVAAAFVAGGVLRRFELASGPGPGDLAFDTRCVPVAGADGRVDHVLIFCRDVTDRRRLQAAVREQQERSRLALEYGQVGHWECDIATNLLHWCDGVVRILGVERPTGPVPLERFLSMVHPADRVLLDTMRMAWRRDESAEVECRIRRPDGSERWIFERGRLERHPDGAPRRTLGIIQDITDRKLAEIALRESEERFRNLLELSADYYWEQDAELRFTAQSRAGGSAAPPTVPIMIGLRRWEVPDLEASEAVWAEHRACLARREPFRDLLIRRRLQDGSAITMLVSGQPIYDPDGTFRGYRGVARNITEYQKAKQEVEESEARFQRMAGSLREILWFGDAQPFRFRFINAAFERIVGIPSDHVYADPSLWLSIVHPDDRATLVASTADWFAQPHPGVVEQEYRIVRPDGAVRWLRARRARTLRADTGTLEVSGIAEDITEQRVAQAALRGSEALFRRLAENVPEVFWVGTPDFSRLDYVSPAIERITGLQREAVYERPDTFRALMAEEDRPALDRFLARQSEGLPAQLDARIVRTDGETRWLWVESFPFSNSDGEALVTGIVHDVTERRLEHERKLREAVHQRDTLVREVHHRIKNNLQGVVGLLRRHAARTPRLGHALDSAIAQVQSIAIVHGLQGHGPLGSIALAEMLPAIGRMVGGLSEARVELAGTDGGTPAFRVAEGEAVAVALILNELALNAAKHGQDASGRLWLRLALSAGPDGSACVRIVNPGRLPPGFAYPLRGMGTGLRLVQSLAPEQGFDIAFVEIDGGVEVTVRLQQPVVSVPTGIPAAA